VLVVDDEPIMLRTLGRIMKKWHPDWEVCGVETGEAALALLERQPVDVLVTDLRMSGMQGRTLLQLCRTHHRKVIRVVHSAQVDSLPPDADPPLAHRRVAKPASTRELLAALEWAVEAAVVRRRPNGNSASM